MKCPRCESDQINRNGHKCGRQNYICRQCGRQFLESFRARGYSDDAKNICLKMYASGVGFRAIERATGISHNTVINWVRQERKRLSDVSQSEENSEISLEDSEFDQPKILEPQNINSLLQQRIYELSLLQKCFSKLLSARFLKSLTSIYHDVIVQAL
ncbi:MAG TPA: hypothetical protein V6C84_15320 [Coleofasciculaceae cyanobacterium]